MSALPMGYSNRKWEDHDYYYTCRCEHPTYDGLGECDRCHRLVWDARLTR